MTCSTSDSTTLSAPPAGRSRNAAAENAYLCLVIQAHAPLAEPVRISLASLREVMIHRASSGAREVLVDKSSTLHLRICDRLTSSTHGRFVQRSGQWFYEDAGSKNGTLINGANIARSRLSHGDVIEIGTTMFMFVCREQADPDEDVVTYGSSATGPMCALETLSADLAAHFSEVRLLARRSVPMLIQGETGTGKELTARAIHELSGRAGEFVAVNCGAIPATLIESELFGHVRGAFSGAVEDRPGLVRRAQHGTLFLDEVAELSLASQVALLRVLQEREVRPVGGTTHVSVDVRVVAATHQDLEERVANGSFRQDLFARLAGFIVRLPSLRERREDLGALVASVLRRAGADAAASLSLSSRATRTLLRHPFPRNIRELQQSLEVAIGLADGKEIDLPHLPPDLRGQRDCAELSESDAALYREVTDRLRLRGGNVAAVARDMGKAPIQIRRWCRRLGIDIPSFRG